MALTSSYDSLSGIGLTSGLNGYASVVSLWGEHDLATNDQLRLILAPLCGRVLVDLSACSLLDATTLGVILDKADHLGLLGYVLELRTSGTATIVTRVLDILDIAGIIDIHPSRG
jgi:anti-anti-sigma regulatory factor